MADRIQLLGRYQRAADHQIPGGICPRVCKGVSSGVVNGVASGVPDGVDHRIVRTARHRRLGGRRVGLRRWAGVDRGASGLNLKLHANRGVDFSGSEFADACAELGPDPVEFEPVGRAQAQYMLAFIVAQAEQRLDPGFVKLRRQLLLEAQRTRLPVSVRHLGVAVNRLRPQL